MLFSVQFSQGLIIQQDVQSNKQSSSDHVTFCTVDFELCINNRISNETQFLYLICCKCLTVSKFCNKALNVK